MPSCIKVRSVSFFQSAIITKAVVRELGVLVVAGRVGLLVVGLIEVLELVILVGTIIPLLVGVVVGVGLFILIGIGVVRMVAIVLRRPSSIGLRLPSRCLAIHDSSFVVLSEEEEHSFDHLVVGELGALALDQLLLLAGESRASQKNPSADLL